MKTLIQSINKEVNALNDLRINFFKAHSPYNHNTDDLNKTGFLSWKIENCVTIFLSKEAKLVYVCLSRNGEVVSKKRWNDIKEFERRIEYIFKSIIKPWIVIDHYIEWDCIWEEPLKGVDELSIAKEI